MHEVLVNRLGGLSLPRKSVVRLTDRPDMTLDIYRGRKTTMQLQKKQLNIRYGAKFTISYCVLSNSFVSRDPVCHSSLPAVQIANQYSCGLAHTSKLKTSSQRHHAISTSILSNRKELNRPFISLHTALAC